MNNTTFTPGPWRWEERRDDTGRMTALLLVTEDRPRPLNDPVILAVREDWHGLHRHRAADAALIAAAPDLLATVKALAWFIENVPDDDPDRTERFFQVREMWRTAIGKAQPGGSHA